MANINLPNGNAYGKITVTPVNWETGGDELMKADWKMRYLFYSNSSSIGMLQVS
jgi:hypothetical protein